MAGSFWIDARSGAPVRAGLACRLVDDRAFAHSWLCHGDGSKCPDGCDSPADPARLELYLTIPERGAVQTGGD